MFGDVDYGFRARRLRWSFAPILFVDVSERLRHHVLGKEPGLLDPQVCKLGWVKHSSGLGHPDLMTHPDWVGQSQPHETEQKLLWQPLVWFSAGY